MINGRSLIDTTDWASLDHAYGAAHDAPDVLLALLSGDPEAAVHTLGYLDAAVLRQGAVYPATAPAARFVAAVLADPRTDLRHPDPHPWAPGTRHLRAGLITWLGAVADAASTWDTRADHSPAAQAVREARTDLHAAVAPFLDDPDADVRTSALDTVGFLLHSPALAHHRPGHARRLHDPAAPVVTRVAAALTIGGWGSVPEDFRTDPVQVVRVAAALAPALDGDPGALAEVKRALRDPAAADRWLSGHFLPQLWGHLRFTLVEVLLRRTSTLEEILPEAVAVARMTVSATAREDWGPLLTRAFPRPAGALSPAQAEFLAALVDNDGVWDRITPLTWFRGVGLPHTREGLRGLLARR